MLIIRGKSYDIASPPQGAYEIDWSRSITRGLRMCAVNDDLSPLPRELVTGQRFQFGGADDFPTVASSRLGGLCISNEAGATDRGFVTLPTTFGLAASEITIAGWGCITSVLGSSGGALIKIGDGSTGYGIGFGDGTWDGLGNKFVALYEAVAWFDSGFTIPDVDIMHHFVMTISALDGSKLFYDGRLVFSFSNTAVTPANSTGLVGYNSLQRQIWGRGQLFCGWNRVLSVVEIQGLFATQTRWSMFKRMPDVNAVFVPAADGSILPHVIHHMRQQGMA